MSLVVASRFYQALSEEITLWIPYSNAGQGASMNFFTDVNIFDLDRVYYGWGGFHSYLCGCLCCLFRLRG